jgi:2-polyprenyl-3-methyl-5-hydroxy-6-metoxy-1,4-benzoquinol methylase
MPVFEKYADYYDLFYQNKNTEEECDFIIEAFRRFGAGETHTILDVGCGTGRHATALAQKGYAVQGLDASETMLLYATKHAEEKKVKLSVHKGDMRSFSLPETFDAIISLFAAAGYLTDNDDILKTFSNINRHLKIGGMFVFDVWNGLAVLSICPETRVNTFDVNGKLLLRTVRPELDTVHHLCRNHYCICLADEKKPAQIIHETHTMRFYFPQELLLYLTCTGFSVEHICAFPFLSIPADHTQWSMAVIAKKTKELCA